MTKRGLHELQHSVPVSFCHAECESIVTRASNFREGVRSGQARNVDFYVKFPNINCWQLIKI